MRFVLPDTDHMYYIWEEDIVFRRHYCWVIYAQFDVPDVEEDKVTVFLVATLINKLPQADGVKVLHPKEGSDDDKVWHPEK